MGQSRHLLFIFVLFSSQFKYKLKKQDVVLGDQNWGCRIAGADGSTELPIVAPQIDSFHRYKDLNSLASDIG